MYPKTKEREERIIKHFHKLLRSGKDYSTASMYSEAGEICYVGEICAGNFVRKHYNAEVITDDMRSYVKDINHLSHPVMIELFSKRYKFCNRESRLILRYIRRKLTFDKKAAQ